jgi:hypothetical protein
VTDGETSESAYVLSVVRSDANGEATIRTDKAEAFTIGEIVSIGDAENIVFEAAEGVPQAVQGLTGDFLYTWEFREVFEDEFSDGWTDVNPWA